MRDEIHQFWPHAVAYGVVLAKQHCRPRAAVVQLLRVASPCALLGLLAYAVSNLKAAAIRKMEESTVPDLEDQFLDYCFCFAELCSIMMGVSFFVNRLATQSASGLRHLLHVSGLSRIAFWWAFVCVEGLLQGAVDAMLVAVIGSQFLQIRVIQNTSFLLLAVALSLIISSAALLGCMLQMLLRSPKASNIVTTVLSVVLTTAASLYSSSQAVVPNVRLPWFVICCPVMTSYQLLWTLAKACGSTGGGHCLSVQDMNDGPLYSPVEMLFGSERSAEASPGAAFFSLSVAVVMQQVLLWPLVLGLDMLRHPSLQRAWKGTEVGGNGASEAEMHKKSTFALQVKQLVHWYDWLPCRMNAVADGQITRVLDGLSFDIRPGGMLGLLGPNGAGKTTTIRCITGEELPRMGCVSLCAQRASSDARSSGPEDFALVDEASVDWPGSPRLKEAEEGLLDDTGEKRNIMACLGLCPQESALCADLSVEEHLLFFARLRQAAYPERVAGNFLHSIRLDLKATATPDELSGGMRRRLAVGCAMVAQPAVALLDEPTTGLDPVARREIWTAVLSARDAGTACLLTTHMLEEAEELCTYIVVLSRGQVAAEGSVQHLKDLWSIGYMLHVEARAGEESRAKEYVASLLPDVHKVPARTSLHGQMIFNVSKDTEFVGNLFLQLARDAAPNGVRHWGITQASLEDAYMRIITQ